MKKILFLNLIGLLPAFLMAQDVALNHATAASATTFTMPESGTSSAASKKEARISRQFTKANKFFNQDFKDASDVHWTTEKNGFIASFTQDNNRNLAWYRKDGSLQYSMATYTADKLPAAEQRIIENDYAGYKMTSVDEIHQDNIVVYVVHLENDRHIKLVTVCDGNTNVYKEYNKM